MYLKISYEKDRNELSTDEGFEFKHRNTPFSASDIINCSIHSCELMTNEDKRKVYNLKFSREDICFNFEPGDTIGILPSNNEELVDKILLRLGLENVADQYYKLNVDQNGTKKLAIPKHIPIYGTLRNVLLHNVDLKSVPKKLFLKSLLNYTEDEEDRERLSFLCSKEGSSEYRNLISSFNKRSLLAMLEAFPSCRPPIEVLLEHLPPLLPRAYSISSSPLNEEYMSITFNIDTFPDNQEGLCAGWLQKCIDEFNRHKLIKIPIYLRTSSKFVLPIDDSVPIILIATGTGISPFRGFLEHRHRRISCGASYGKSWLFYGCRDSRNNFLYKDDLKEYLESGALYRMSIAFSRESETRDYVQDEIAKNLEELSSWILCDNAVVYVCGDFLKVLPAVRAEILRVLMVSPDFLEDDAQLYLKKMVEEGRYIVDNWN